MTAKTQSRGPRARARLLALALALAPLTACGGGAISKSPIDEPLPDLPEAPIALDEDGKPRVIVRGGGFPDLEGRINVLPSGPTVLFVRNDVDGADALQEGVDVSEQAMALWLRGRGRLRHLRPEFTLGPVNAGVQEDWHVDLPPGEYLLSVTKGGDGEVLVVVR